ncbi:uncharacterized protein LOC110244271 isoform X3 [Exaiptasia diaphana]|uniref:Uncharacterized protein n=1 Tax=Exaiptasia diaphana TaxID=2652724 RepID=A0A913XLC3_EXADI|nr:uncharacterized protein LOC110244271 isoform X3 [Exaiptasia diaphana]
MLVHLHSLISDLPGKAVIMLHKLFNGLFGCTICFHPGLRLNVRGNVRVYPFGKDYEIRDSDEMRKHAIMAEFTQTEVFGIKGFSVLHNYISLPEGCPVDYMHCILQGTGKWIIQAILNSKNKDTPYYLKPRQQKILNEKLSKIAVPHDMDRKPRSLDHIKYWKAIEVQHFLLYFGLPLLKGMLHEKYFHHFALLTSAT